MVWWMRPRPPPFPPPSRRARSRSPLSRQQGGLIDAYHRNCQTRRGGRQARARTRGIHRGILKVLKERILRLIAVLGSGPRVQVYNTRIEQIDQRIQHLHNNWVEDRNIVLPGLRERTRSEGVRQHSSRVVEVESDSDLETVVHFSGGEEEEDPIVLHSSYREDWSQEVASSSSSAKAKPKPVANITPSRVRYTPKAKATGSAFATPADSAKPTIKAIPYNTQSRLECAVHQGQASLFGTAVISWDFHQVLDCFRFCSSRASRCWNGQLPVEPQRVVEQIYREGQPSEAFGPRTPPELRVIPGAPECV